MKIRDLTESPEDRIRDLKTAVSEEPRFDCYFLEYDNWDNEELWDSPDTDPMTATGVTLALSNVTGEVASRWAGVTPEEIRTAVATGSPLMGPGVGSMDQEGIVDENF